jgi:hypothetical protein
MVNSSENSDSNVISSFSFEDTVDNLHPALQFFVEETPYPDYQYNYKILISCAELPEYIPQTISIVSPTKWNVELDREHYIDLVDIDFDGYNDIQVCTGKGVVNTLYAYFRWHVYLFDDEDDEDNFETEPFFEMVTMWYDLYPETKQIISTVRNNAASRTREMYQLEDTQNGGWYGSYKLIRHETQDLAQSENEILTTVFFGERNIFSKMFSSDDYDGTDIVNDNYLRFGVSNPISIDDAIDLLFQKYGREDAENGFQYNFIFEEMFLHDDLSCYKFQMQWLVDENHWSTIDLVGVTPDGKVIEDDTSKSSRFGLSGKFDYEHDDISYYKVASDERKQLSFSIVDNGTLWVIANVVSLTSRMSVGRGGISDINYISEIMEIRRINDDEISYYSIFGNKDGGRLYVFFRGTERIISQLTIYSEKKLIYKDFDSLEVDVSTFEDVRKIDPSVDSNINEGENFEIEGTYHEDVFQTFHMTAEGYVVIDYKKVGNEQIVHKIALKKREYIKGINELDLP